MRLMWFSIPWIWIPSCVLQLFISKLVEDIKHHHRGQRLSRLSEQSIRTKHHGGERGTVERWKKKSNNMNLFEYKWKNHNKLASLGSSMYLALVTKVCHCLFLFFSFFTCACTSAGLCQWCQPKANQKDWRLLGLWPYTEDKEESVCVCYTIKVEDVIWVILVLKNWKRVRGCLTSYMLTVRKHARI